VVSLPAFISVGLFDAVSHTGRPSERSVDPRAHRYAAEPQAKGGRVLGEVHQSTSQPPDTGAFIIG
jgi:hypothetical protein